MEASAQISSESAPIAAPAPAAPERYHSLDALRAVALLLGIFLHSALAYIPGPGFGWAVQDRSTHAFFGVAILVVHAFRLEVFFLIAGFFARSMVVRRGIAGFTLNRLTRVLVPFVLGWFLVFPWLAFAWIWGGRHGEPSAARVALQQIPGAMAPALQGLVRHPFGYFPLTHLWFLYCLMLVYALFMAARGLWRGVLDRRGAWGSRLDRLFNRIIETRWTIPVLAALTWPILLSMRDWGVDTPDKTFLPSFRVLLLYGLVFGVGWLFHHQPGLLETIRRRWWASLVCALLLIVPVVILCGYQGQDTHPHLRELRGLFFLAYALLMWSWVTALLGLFLRFRSRESFFWRYLSDSAYWVYIMHLPIVVILQVAASRFAFSCWVKCAGICAVTFVVSLASYHYLVRPTPIGMLLNGRRYPFRWLPFSH